MEFDTLPIVILVAGMVLMYSAISNRNPIDVLNISLTGGDLDTARPIMTDSSNAPPGPGAVDGATLPGTPQADGDARTDPPGFDPKRDDVLPILPGEGAAGSGVVAYRRPFFPGGNRAV